MSTASEWNIQQKALKELIGKKDTFDKAKDLYLSMHRYLHFSDNDNTLMDQLWKMLDKKDFSIMPTTKDVTIAWNIWHITRIEDLTVNILLNCSEQIYNKKWQKKMKVSVTDTGNAMTDDEIMELSRNMNIEVLKEYRKVVGDKIENLKDELENLKLKLKPENLSNEDIRKQILDECTNGEYSRDLSVLTYYKIRKENGLVVSIANLKKVESRVEELEKMFTITPEDIELRKQVIREKNVEIKSQISEKSKELNIQFKLLNKLRINNIRIPNVRRHRSSNYSPKLKVAKSGRIEFDDEKEKRRRGNEWER